MSRQILIVDDNKQLLEELIPVFEDNGIEVSVAGSGTEALDKSSEKVFDVVIIDIRLPDAHGIELIDKIKRNQPRAVYLLITAYASVDSSIKALHRGVLDYILKPFDAAELLNSVKRGFVVKDSCDAELERIEDLIKEKGILQAKVLVLEQYNELFIDREKKILDLKKEVNELSRQLKLGIKYQI